MNRRIEPLIAWLGVFAGSLLWDVAFGNGIQKDDAAQAFACAAVAAAIQWLLSSRRRA